MKVTRVFFLIVLSILVLSACSSGTPTPAVSSVTEVAFPEPNMPRQPAVSASNLQKGEGTNICSQFPSADAPPFEPGAGSPLNVVPGEHMLGASKPILRMIVYSDFGCETCAELAINLKTVVERYPETLQVVFRHFPQSFNSTVAAEASEAAAAQAGDEAFWKLHDLLFERRSEWTQLSTESFRNVLTGYLTELELDADAVNAELEAGTYQTAINYAVDNAPLVGVSSAPTVIFNDKPTASPPTSELELDYVVQEFVLRARFPVKPPLVIDPTKDYAAWIETEKGDIAINLFADVAPETVNNFMFLACSGFFDDITWHRVLDGFVAQSGDPTGTGFGGPAYTIPDEFMLSGLTFDRAGLLSMAKTNQPNSANSQFFITLGPTQNLTGTFTIFGQVASGLEVAKSLSLRDPQPGAAILPPGDKLIRIIVRQTSK